MMPQRPLQHSIVKMTDDYQMVIAKLNIMSDEWYARVSSFRMSSLFYASV